MRLLIVTQEMDKESKTLGFFHEWVRALAPHYESIEVICLKEGKHTLPENVHVHSLGKEKGKVPGFVYALRFKSLAWKLRKTYDAVFVHMNQEYILVGGPMWKFLGKPIYMWRNHYAGSWLTDLAALFCTKIFCTSQHSYTARYKKTVRMPVGVDIERFAAVAESPREANTILFLARLSPSKHLEMLIEAVVLLAARGVSVQVSIVGDYLPGDASYVTAQNERVEEAGLSGMVHFYPGVSHEETPSYYGRHAIFVNCSQSGMFDKTLFEAAAAGCLVLAMSEDFSNLTQGSSSFSNVSELAGKVLELQNASESTVQSLRNHLRETAMANSLGRLCERLVGELYST